jgi:amino acid adenylation domain-containing protein
MHSAIPQLQDYIVNSAIQHPDKVALVCGTKQLTYQEIDQKSTALAQSLIKVGIQAGDRVIVFADNTPETVISFWGVLKANAVISIVNPLTKADKLAYLLNDCRAKVLISDAHIANIFKVAVTQTSHLISVIVSGNTNAELLDSLPKGITFDEALNHSENTLLETKRIDIDLASIIYTSGSTGDPKGVMLTHRNMLTAATSVVTYLGYTESDKILCALPLAFDYGLYQMIMSFRQGACLVLERSFTFPTQILKVMEQQHCTVFPGVPTMFSILTNMDNLSDFDLSRIRIVSNTAAALHLKHIDSIKQIFKHAEIFSMYGLTECKRCTYLPPKDLDRKKGSVGIAIPNTELWVIDEEGKRLPPNSEGELVIRGATVMLGYWEKPESTARRLYPGPLPNEMVLHTGDICRVDDEGYVYFVARMDDIIKSRGEKVAPKEVETQIQHISGILECAVIGVPDEILGSAIKAFVVLAEGVELTPKMIQNEARLRLESFMVPQEIVIVESLPKTDTGKIKKTGLN